MIIAVIMGSESDWETMCGAHDILDALQIPHVVEVISAHRMPDELFRFAESARSRGIRAIIAGA